MINEYNTFSKFYPFYLSQHRDLMCRRLHFIGSSLVIITLLYTVYSHYWNLVLILPILGYGFAWTGHFFFEKNRPVTFTYPIYSLIGDWVMFKDILIGKIKI